jgi:predicted nuclease of predicted toxin-antitoxin system
MRILLDECLPRDLARQFPGHNVKTVSQTGWAGISNGQLLRLIADSAKYDVFLTIDKRLPHQNEIRRLPFAVVVLHATSNRMNHLFPFAREILRRLPEFQPGHAYVLRQPS